MEAAKAGHISAAAPAITNLDQLKTVPGIEYTVRSAVVECAKRTFARTEAAIIAQAAMTLLSRESAWGRWTTERRLLIETFRRPDVAAALASIIQKTQTGAVASVLQRALQESGIDPFLEDLAEKAAQPAVRAITLQALIDGYAQWPSGFAWQWIDKSMGKGACGRSASGPSRPASREEPRSQQASPTAPPPSRRLLLTL